MWDQVAAITATRGTISASSWPTAVVISVKPHADMQNANTVQYLYTLYLSSKAVADTSLPPSTKHSTELATSSTVNAEHVPTQRPVLLLASVTGELCRCGGNVKGGQVLAAKAGDSRAARSRRANGSQQRAFGRVYDDAVVAPASDPNVAHTIDDKTVKEAIASGIVQTGRGGEKDLAVGDIASRKIIVKLANSARVRVNVVWRQRIPACADVHMILLSGDQSIPFDVPMSSRSLVVEPSTSTLAVSHIHFCRKLTETARRGSCRPLPLGESCFPR